MIATTYASTPVLLLNNAPQWVDRFKASFELLAQFDESLTAREGRRAYSQSLRAKVSFKIVLDAASSIQFKAQMRSYQAQPVLVPLWPAAQTWANRSAITASGLFIAYKTDWSQWEIYTTSAPGWPASTDMVAPLLWGRLESRELLWINATVSTFDVNFLEAGPVAYAVAPNAVTFGAGPSLAGYASAPDLWPFALDWAGVPETFTLKILREQLGFQRTQLETIYPQTDAREAKFNSILQSASDLWSFLAFFASHGAGTTFWCPMWHSCVIMTADLAGGGTALSVTDTAGVLAGGWVAFSNGNGIAATAQVLSLSGGNTVNLVSAPGAFASAFTVVSALVITRLEKPKVEVEWINCDVALVSVSVSEQTAEYAPAADETLGTTLGALTRRGYLYVLQQVFAGSAVRTGFTSYEQDLTYGGNTYTSRKIDHGQLKGSLFIDRDEVEILTEILAGDPLTQIAVGSSESTTRVEIYSVDVSGSVATNAVQIFSGDILSAATRGSRISAKAVTGGTVFDRLFPRMRLQIGCNHSVFSPGCTLATSSWKFSAVIDNPGTAGFPFTFDLNSVVKVGGGTPTFTAGYFAGGWVEFGSGANTVKRQILNSTVVSGGVMTLTLNRDPVVFPTAGNSIYLYPGCDSAFATCTAKFANNLNFGGMPFVPAANPSLVKLQANAGGGKK